MGLRSDDPVRPVPSCLDRSVRWPSASIAARKNSSSTARGVRLRTPSSRFTQLARPSRSVFKASSVSSRPGEPGAELRERRGVRTVLSVHRLTQRFVVDLPLARRLAAAMRPHRVE